MILVPIIFSISNIINWGWQKTELDPTAIWIILIGTIFILLGFKIDKKITKWEMWFIKKYQTSGENPDKEADKNLYPSSPLHATAVSA